jgi:hypothetical protein
MIAHDKLARLRFEDPAAAAAVVDALWDQLAREEPRMFAALWRRANRPSRRPAAVERIVPVVQWIDEAVETPTVTPSLSALVEQMPAVNLVPTVSLSQVPAQALPPTVPAAPPAAPALEDTAAAPAPPVVATPAPAPAPAPVPSPYPLMIEPSPSLAELLPAEERSSA